MRRVTVTSPRPSRSDLASYPVATRAGVHRPFAAADLVTLRFGVGGSFSAPISIWQFPADRAFLRSLRENPMHTPDACALIAGRWCFGPGRRGREACERASSSPALTGQACYAARYPGRDSPQGRFASCRGLGGGRVPA